jgi:hypothetical protein
MDRQEDGVGVSRAEIRRERTTGLAGKQHAHAELMYSGACVREEDAGLRASSRPSSFMAGTHTGEVEVSDGHGN